MSDGYQITIAGLLRRREETTARMAVLQDQLAYAIAELDHLDATIRIFDPDADLGDADRRPPPMFVGLRGELTRFALDMLRRSPVPISTTDIAEAALLSRGGNPADRRAMAEMKKKIGMRSSRQSGEGMWRPRRCGRVGR